MIESFITFVLSNFTLTFFVLGIVGAFIRCSMLSPERKRFETARIVLGWFLFFSIGLSFLYNFVMHVFFAEMAAQFIGWANSPFQYEVGYASLGFGIVGIIATWSRISFRAAALIGPAFFLWGAAGGHISQIVTEHNMAPGNTGIMLWSDILLPVIGFLLLGWQKAAERKY